MRKNNDCIEYEYKTVTVSKKLHQDWEDVYSNLGWNVVERRHIRITPVSALISSFSTSSYDNMVQSNDMYEKVDLKLKRSHNIKNKNRISKVETTIKETLEEIEESVNKKYKKSVKYIYMTVIIGIMLFISSFITIDPKILKLPSIPNIIKLIVLLFIQLIIDKTKSIIPIIPVI